MKRKKQVWVSEDAYRSAKVESALQGLKLTQYLDKKLCTEKDEPIITVPKKNTGYYGFLK